MKKSYFLSWPPTDRETLKPASNTPRVLYIAPFYTSPMDIFAKMVVNVEKDLSTKSAIIHENTLIIPAKDSSTEK